MGGNGIRVVLLVATPGTTWGGMEKHTAELATGLARRGHDVHVLGHPAYRDHFGPDIHYHPLPVQRSRHHPLLRRQLQRLLRSLRPDICHAQGNKAIRLLRRPAPGTGLVGTVHGIKRRHPGLTRLDRVIAISKPVLDSLSHPHKTLIHNGCMVAEPSGAAHANPQARGIHAIAVGRLEPVKGFDRLITAWSHLPADRRLTILGEGSERPRLEALISRLELGDRVRLAGLQHNVADWLQGADVCVISSLREGFSYVLIEALQAGCPVLATPIAGARELLPPEAIASAVDGEGLRNLLSRQLGALEALRQLEQPAMIRARTEFTIDRMVERTEQVYRQSLAERRAGVQPGKAAMIDLTALTPFASGANRHCFVHPDDPARCLKVIRPENIEARFRRQPAFKRLLGRQRLNDNLQEQRAYRQTAIQQLIAAGKEEIPWQHLPRFFGSRATSAGAANESELIRTAAGDIAPTLERYLARNGFDPDCRAAVERFCQWLGSTGILTRNLLPHNLVLSDRTGRPELHLVDGLGAPAIPDWVAAVPGYRQRYIDRKIRRFRKRIDWELSGRHGDWQDASRL